MPQSTKERQEALRARRLMLGMTEVRGIYLRPEQHAELKAYAKKLAKKPPIRSTPNPPLGERVTDLQRFIELYRSVGIELVPETTDDGTPWLTLKEGDPKVGGYLGFYTSIEFDKDGKFVQQSVWE